MLNLLNNLQLVTVKVSKCQSVKAISAAIWPGQNRKAIFATQMPLMSDANAKGQIRLVLRGREKEGSRHSLTSGSNLIRRHLNSHDRFHRLIFVHCSFCAFDSVSTISEWLNFQTRGDESSVSSSDGSSCVPGYGLLITASSNDKHPD